MPGPGPGLVRAASGSTAGATAKLHSGGRKSRRARRKRLPARGARLRGRRGRLRGRAGCFGGLWADTGSRAAGRGVRRVPWLGLPCAFRGALMAPAPLPGRQDPENVDSAAFHPFTAPQQRTGGRPPQQWRIQNALQGCLDGHGAVGRLLTTVTVAAASVVFGPVASRPVGRGSQETAASSPCRRPVGRHARLLLVAGAVVDVDECKTKRSLARRCRQGKGLTGTGGHQSRFSQRSVRAAAQLSALIVDIGSSGIVHHRHATGPETSRQL